MTPIKVLEHFNSDIESYRDNIEDLALLALEQNPTRLEYWVAWFEGASSDELEEIDRKKEE